MLSFLPFLAALAVTTSPAGAPAPIQPFPAAVTSAVDTGSTADSIVLLTPALITPYAAAERALKAYWDAHPDQAKQAEAHAHDVNITMPTEKWINGNQGANIPGRGGSQGMHTTSGFSVPDYPTVVQQDTAVAAIFTTAHLAPAQFEPTERSVRTAIAAVLNKAPADSTMLGQNMAVVRAHRPELAADWSEVQMAIQINQGFQHQLKQVWNQQAQNLKAQGHQSDLEP